MADGQADGDNAKLLLRTIRGTADFSGRSRRTEVLYYMIACALVGVVLDFGLMMVLPHQTTSMASAIFGVLSGIPTFALFVRRIHDQNRSGWWGLLLPFALALSVAQPDTAVRMQTQAVGSAATLPFALLSLASYIAVLVIYLLPGTSGPNRFGPDPRMAVDVDVFR